MELTMPLCRQLMGKKKSSLTKYIIEIKLVTSWEAYTVHNFLLQTLL